MNKRQTIRRFRTGARRCSSTTTFQFSFIMYQNIVTGMNTGAVVNLHSLIDQLEAQLRFRIKLTPDQRQSMVTVGDRRISFLGKGHRYAQRHPNLLPQYRNIQDFDRVMFDFEELQQVLDRVNTLQEGLADTLKQIGANAFEFSLIFYDLVGKASEGGIPGTEVIYKDLAKHFVRINSSDDVEKSDTRTIQPGKDEGPSPSDDLEGGNLVAA
jgi:hypothetical protein